MENVSSNNKLDKSTSCCGSKVPQTLRYQKLSDEALDPIRATRQSSGIDIPTPKGFRIPPHRSKKVNTGLRFEIPQGYDMIVDNRSSVATKKGCIRGAGVIDGDYRGELIIHLINTTDKVQSFKRGDKIAQLILREVWLGNIEEVEEINTDTERGEGGFGHTDNKDK